MNQIRKLFTTGLVITTVMPMAALAYFPEDFGLDSVDKPSSSARVLADTDTDDATTNDEDILTDDTLTPNPNANGADFLAPFVAGDTGDANGITAVFDVRAFRSHPCFNAVGEEQAFCLQSLGITSDFAEMAESNSLGESIVQYTLDQQCENLSEEELTACLSRNAELLPQLVSQFSLAGSFTGTGSTTVNAGEDDVDTDQGIRMSRQERSERLWELCDGHELSQAGCYQQFIRAVTDESVDMTELEEILGRGGSTAPSDTDDTDATTNTRRSNRATDTDTTDDTRTDDTMNDTDTTDLNEDTSQTNQNNDVLSETAEEGGLPANMDERGEWLWDLCADMGTDQSMCYRTHFRTTANWQEDEASLRAHIQG